jgi:2-oxoglutarate dehydrogenase E2 component (dihydrolipoamide succinyltransferase)
MARPVRIPPFGETSDELRIAGWLRSEGDEVALGEALFEVETDKATLEVEATSAGILLRIVHGTGAEVAVGTVIGSIATTGEEQPEGLSV